MYPIFRPLYLYINCSYCIFYVLRLSDPVTFKKSYLFGISTKYFQYPKAHELLSDHHLCQLAPRLQSRLCRDIHVLNKYRISISFLGHVQCRNGPLGEAQCANFNFQGLILHPCLDSPFFILLVPCHVREASLS